MQRIGIRHFQSGDSNIYFLGHEKLRKNGVAFIASKSITRMVPGYNGVNDQVILIRLHR